MCSYIITIFSENNHIQRWNYVCHSTEFNCLCIEKDLRKENSFYPHEHVHRTPYILHAERNNSSPSTSALAKYSTVFTRNKIIKWGGSLLVWRQSFRTVVMRWMRCCYYYQAGKNGIFTWQITNFITFFKYTFQILLIQCSQSCWLGSQFFQNSLKSLR